MSLASFVLVVVVLLLRPACISSKLCKQFGLSGA